MENWKQKPSNGGRKPNADYNGKKSEQPPKEKIFPNIDVNREFKPSWIISGIDGDFIKFAENVGGIWPKTESRVLKFVVYIARLNAFK